MTNRSSPQRIASRGKEGKYSQYNRTKISFGLPAQICVAVMDKKCPCCGVGRDYGFDLLLEKETGEFEGARCEKCGWSA